MDTNNAEVLEQIMRLARQAVEWQVNLVLSSREIDVLLLEFARLKAVEKSARALQAGTLTGGRQN